ncbi:MAG: calcium-binding protein [Sphingomicrobium sp.]
MPRATRGPIDVLAGYTVIDPADPPDTPDQDYYIEGNYTIWGVGLVTFGPPTAAQQAWIADSSNYGSLADFPTDYVSFGFPLAQTPLSLWQSVTVIRDQLLLNEQGFSGANSWSIGGVTGTGDFYWSDAAVINGTDVGQTLTGTAVAETLNGLGGDDTLIGGGGSDALHGGTGNDHLIGGAGVDRLFGDDGNDLLDPGSDAAFLYVGGGGLTREGVFFVDGGAGFDTLVLDYSSGIASQSISGAQALASDQVVNVEAVNITGSQYSDFLTGSANADQLFGGGGFDYLSGGGGNDTLDAGAPGASSVTPIGAGGHTNADALSLDHLFTAGSGPPSVSFSIRSVETKVSDDWGLRPPAGNIYSFTVANAADQGFLQHTADPGLGDVFEFHVRDENGVEVAWDWSDPANPIDFPHAGTYFLEVVIFNQNIWDFSTIDVTLSLEGADVLTTNVLEGGTGDDTYIVYSATDHVVEQTGEGTDLVRSSASFALSDNVENLTLTGTAAINGTGNGLANTIIGNSAANVISGGGGADRLTGGLGGDIFKFTALSDSAPGASDLITDFSGLKGKPAQGDKIDLSAIDANSHTGANDAFALVNKFTGHAGQAYASWDKQSGTTKVYLDVDGDRSADMVIQLSGHLNLVAGDFIL